jgi:hypothetical protein
MQVPSRFNLLGREITVIYDTERCNARGAFGYADLSYDTIYLAEELDGKPIPTPTLAHTFLHEALHFMLDAMGENKLGNNEKFVDLLSGLMHQMLTTSQSDDSQD